MGKNQNSNHEKTNPRTPRNTKQPTTRHRRNQNDDKNRTHTMRKPGKCHYCDQEAITSVNGIQTCKDHTIQRRYQSYKQKVAEGLKIMKK
tara:strand:- start:802 stop:1071 length:270 start_codon:yes stop_codon:yes gene_type:complete